MEGDKLLSNTLIPLLPKTDFFCLVKLNEIFVKIKGLFGRKNVAAKVKISDRRKVKSEFTAALFYISIVLTIQVTNKSIECVFLVISSSWSRVLLYVVLKSCVW